MGASTNGVFHYTGSSMALYEILHQGFYPSYCKERLVFNGKQITFAVPMVSFCDLPLSLVKEHMVKYGNYAIGLTIEWATLNKLNPVLYLEKNSLLTEGIHNILDFVHNDWHKILGDEDFEEFYDLTYKGSLSVLQSLKSYSGKLIRKNKKSKDNYKFYDEREWRYIPAISLSDVDDYPDIFWKEDLNKIKKKYSSKPHFNKYGVKFTYKDIKYIIVESEHEIPPLISFLEQQHCNLYFDENELNILLTKILTAKQIREDF